jgi:multidrug efflux pump subunit AcrB
MTSFAVFFGVLSLMSAPGAGAEMRQSLGTTVFARHAWRHHVRTIVRVFYVTVQGARWNLII